MTPLLDQSSAEYQDILHYPDQNLITAATEVFHIPNNLREHFDKYYLLHWSPDYLSMICVYGSIYREGIRYVITNMDSAKLASLRNTAQIRISFRKLRDMSYGYALIRRNISLCSGA